MSGQLRNQPHRFPLLLPLAALAFAAAHLAFEHFTGGVQSHNLLNRADMPAISNWLGLLTLPLLGSLLALRVRNHSAPARFASMPTPLVAALTGALLYGAALAISFELGASGVTSALFIGLFLCALALPVYRVEYLMGFVLGMTFTFGGVLPLLVASVMAALSFVVRYAFGLVSNRLRKGQFPRR